jgi:hypothetical protein
MKKKGITLWIFLAAILLTAFSGCVPVKPWQRIYLNDEEMALSARKLEMFELNVEVYREGASGANGGKTGGGCGCN